MIICMVSVRVRGGKAPSSTAVLPRLTGALATDPVFTVSSEVDHYRAGLKAQATKDRFVSLCSLDVINNTNCLVTNGRHGVGSRGLSFMTLLRTYFK